jgi:hypothetical protein
MDNKTSPVTPSASTPVLASAPMDQVQLKSNLCFRLTDANLSADLKSNLTYWVLSQPIFEKAFAAINADTDQELNKNFLKPYFAVKTNNLMATGVSNSSIKLEGIRFPITTTPPLGRTFVADLLYLFYSERMGFFKITGKILDDYATKGEFPINGTTDLANTLESLVMLTKYGESSSVRDRESAYRRCLGWTSDVGKKLELGSKVNNEFNKNFHQFIQYALGYYQEKRLAVAIAATQTPGKPSAATLSQISETINLLKQSFDSYDSGRNHTITVTGIAWIVIGMYLVRELKAIVGGNYDQLAKYMSAAYSLLIEGKSATISDTNRFTVHLSCAESGRNILLSMQGLDHNDKSTKGELENWLELVETTIETYRTAYRSMTGVDLGAPGTPTIEQAA